MGFSIAKFFGGFAFWKGEKLGKLLFYGIIAAFVASLALGIYHKIVAPTYLTENRNIITRPSAVNIDQRQIVQTEEKFIGVKVWFLKLGLSWDAAPSLQSSTGSVE